MLLKKLVTCFATFMTIVTPVLPQTTHADGSEKTKEKLRREVEKKINSLVDDIIKTAPSLKLPENRIRIQVNAASLLWPRDETQARALFKEAVDGVLDLLNGISATDPQQYTHSDNVYNLRNEILGLISQRDPKLALSFVRATRQPPRRNHAYQVGQDPEAMLEIRLAAHLVEKDPEEALRIVEENLPRAFDYNVVNLVSSFQSKDKAMGARLMNAVMKQLRSQDLANDPSSATYVAHALLRMSLEATQAASQQANTEGAISLSQRLLLDQQTIRELCEIVTRFLLNSKSNGELHLHGQLHLRPYNGRGYHNYAVDLLRQLLPLMAEMERFSPSSAASLRKAWAEYEKKEEELNGPANKIQELMQSGTLDQLMEVIPKAPPQTRDYFYQQAAWKAMNQGDTARATEIVNNLISDEGIRSQIMLNIDRNKLSQEADRAGVEEIRSVLLRLPSTEDRLNLLVEFANRAMSRKDKATALRLLDEAQSLIGPRAGNYTQMHVQLQMAHAFRAIDPARSFAIIGAVLEQVNELAAAAAVLNGFDISYFKGGEMILYYGSQLNSIMQQCGLQLGALARHDFDGAKQMIERIQLTEARLMTGLIFAQHAFDNLDSDQ